MRGTAGNSTVVLRGNKNKNMKKRIGSVVT